MRKASYYFSLSHTQIYIIYIRTHSPIPYQIRSQIEVAVLDDVTFTVYERNPSKIRTHNYERVAVKMTLPNSRTSYPKSTRESLDN